MVHLSTKLEGLVDNNKNFNTIFISCQHGHRCNWNQFHRTEILTKGICINHLVSKEENNTVPVSTTSVSMAVALNSVRQCSSSKRTILVNQYCWNCPLAPQSILFRDRKLIIFIPSSRVAISWQPYAWASSSLSCCCWSICWIEIGEVNVKPYRLDGKPNAASVGSRARSPGLSALPFPTISRISPPGG